MNLKTTINNKIFITDPTENIREFCKKELILENPQYQKLLRMGKWVGNTPKQIRLFEVNENTYVLPFGAIDKIASEITEHEYVTDFASNIPVNFGNIPELYDYQVEAVEKCLKAKNGVLIGQCGCGKTRMGLALISQLKQKSLWLTHTHELLVQSKNAYISLFGDDGVGTITGGKVEIGNKITFATVQTMQNVNLTEYCKEWNVVVVDECHRLCGSPTSVTMFYRVLSSLKARHKYGLTATSHRSDGLIQSMYAILGQVIHEIPKNAVADKTMKVEIRPIFIDKELSQSCFDTDGTIVFTKALNEIASDNATINKIVANLRDNASNYNLILSDRLEQLREILKLLDSDKAVMIDGSMTSKKGKEQRQQAIVKMQKGEMNYLFASYSLAKEGLDIPRLNRLHLATPKKDKAVIIQSVGRVARTFEGKEDAVCYDYVQSNWLSKSMYKSRQAIYKKL